MVSQGDAGAYPARGAEPGHLVAAQVPNRERDDLYSRFKRGEIRQLVVSRVANFAVDLPDANVAIQVSGTFGSRQEEAQGYAYFYSLVTRETKDQDFAAKRQLFLTEQGYRYEISQSEDVLQKLAQS